MCYIGSSQKCAVSRVTQASDKEGHKKRANYKTISCTFYCVCYFTQPRHQVINVFGKLRGHVHAIFQACCSIFLASGQENASNAFFAFCFLSVLFFKPFSKNQSPSKLYRLYHLNLKTNSSCSCLRNQLTIPSTISHVPSSAMKQGKYHSLPDTPHLNSTQWDRVCWLLLVLELLLLLLVLK